MAVSEQVNRTTLLARRVRVVGAGNNAVTAKSEGRSINRVLLVALVLGGSVDVLFYKKAAGISSLLFVSLMVGALVTLGLMERVKVAWRNLWIMVPLFFCAGMVAVRANPELTLTNLGPHLYCCSCSSTSSQEGGWRRLGCSATR